MKLRPFVVRYLMPDTGAPSGAPAASPAPPAGSTTPPAAPPNAPPAGAGNEPPADTRTAAQKELDDFVPQAFNENDEPPAVKPPDPTPTPKPGEKPQPPAPKPGEKKAGELPDNAPANKIRERLKEIEKERDEWKQKAEAPNPRLGTLETEISGLKAEREQLAKDVAAARQELAMHDPISSEAVKKLDAEYDEKFTRATQFMPELAGSIQPLVSEFAELKRGDPAKYAAGLREFRQKVADVVGPENAASALNLIAEGLDFITKREAAVKDVRENGTKIHFGSQQKQYADNVALTKTHLAEAIKVADDFETVQPYHPLNFVNKALGVLDDGQKSEHKGWEDNVDKYMLFAANGISPEAMASLQELSPKDREVRLKKIEADRIDAAKWVRAHAKQAAYYNRFLPGILADYARLLEADKKRAAGQPPDPNAPHRSPGTTNPEDIGDDIQKYKPAEVPNY